MVEEEQTSLREISRQLYRVSKSLYCTAVRHYRVLSESQQQDLDKVRAVTLEHSNTLAVTL